MISRIVSRVRRMDASELSWRLRTAAQSTVIRAAAAVQPVSWRRDRLVDRLAASEELGAVRDALLTRQWEVAHRALTNHFVERRRRFVIHPSQRSSLASAINKAFPNASADAAGRAERMLAGTYDLLGYHAVAFDDWHSDPVHGRRAPLQFWSTVPYLDPACGDHKIIWELNRHQHWLALGRACWLTEDSRYRDRFISELSSWLASNPPLIGINWASMLELGFRSISWVWALHFFLDSTARDETPWTIDLLVGLDRQLTHLEQNLSYYFSPNTHLLGEALALYVCGRVLPELRASGRWSATGRRILIGESARQIAADGGHCERSTHYHRYTLDFYLLALAVARITNDPIAGAFERSVARLAAASRLLADDTGHAPHIGDDDGGLLLPIAGRDADDWRDSLGIAAGLTRDESLRAGDTTEEELWMLQPAAATPQSLVSIRSAALSETGYYISRNRSLHVVIDGGPHGYRNGGHAHADALAVNVSYHGCPFLIDAGTACYTIDIATRDRFRATAAHNTVVLDGRSQSIPDGPFHWRVTADASAHRWRTTEGFDYFDGSHDGYSPAMHRRRVFVLHSDLIVVADQVSAPGHTSAAVHWHVDPRWAVDTQRRGASFICEGQRVNLFVAGGRVERFDADATTGLGWHAPVYGRIEPATTIRVTHADAAPFWMVSVFDFNPNEPVNGAEWLPVWAEAGVVQQAAALRIERDGSTDYLLFAEPASSDPQATWRVSEFETDARMLFCRVTDDVLTRLALVDGSMVRGGGRRSLGIALGRTMPALFVDESSIRTFTPCAASPAS